MQLKTVQQGIIFVIYPSPGSLLFPAFKTINCKFTKSKNYFLAFDWSNYFKPP